ncbi:hypothetical protein JCM3775_006172 [Rhodotorula graminis]
MATSSTYNMGALTDVLPPLPLVQPPPPPAHRPAPRRRPSPLEQMPARVVACVARWLEPDLRDDDRLFEGPSPDLVHLSSASPDLRAMFNRELWHSATYVAPPLAGPAPQAPARDLIALHDVVSTGLVKPVHNLSLVGIVSEVKVVEQAAHKVYDAEVQGNALADVVGRLGGVDGSLEAVRLEEIVLFRDVMERILARMTLNDRLKSISIKNVTSFDLPDDKKDPYLFCPVASLACLLVVDSDPLFILLAGQCPALTTLAVASPATLSKTSIESIVYAMPNLKRFSMVAGSCGTTSRLLLQSLLPAPTTVDIPRDLALQELVIDLGNSSFDILVQALALMPQLVKLVVLNAGPVNPGNFAGLVHAAPSLTSLIVLAGDGSSGVSWTGSINTYAALLGRLDELEYFACDFLVGPTRQSARQSVVQRPVRATTYAPPLRAVGKAAISLQSMFIINGKEGDGKWTGAAAKYSRIGPYRNTSVTVTDPESLSLSALTVGRWERDACRA